MRKKEKRKKKEEKEKYFQKFLQLRNMKFYRAEVDGYGFQIYGSRHRTRVRSIVAKETSIKSYVVSYKPEMTRNGNGQGGIYTCAFTRAPLR